jgi:conjugal transfer pilus assembly protein TraK
VFGNIHSSSCGLGAAPAAGVGGTTAALGAPVVNPAGEVVVECDRDKGEIYVRPLSAAEAGGGKPINLFISSAHATYTLLLRRADTPADTIVIRDRTVRAPALEVAPSSPPGPAPSHLRRMKALLIAMASDRPPADVRVEEVNRPLQLWAESRLMLLRRYEARGLVGEKYLLQNTSAAPMVLAEQEFDRPDSRDAGQVLAVAIEHHNLRPGDSTHVYVLRRGGER